MTWHLLACAALFPAALIPAAAIAIICAMRKRRAGGPPAPGAEPAPVPGSAIPPQALAAEPGRPPVRPAPAPGQPHGGDVKIIVVKGDGRVETTDCATGHTEIWPGDCAECTTGQGMCSLCAYWTVFDPLRGRWARRYQRCPAHAGKERQP